MTHRKSLTFVATLAAVTLAGFAFLHTPKVSAAVRAVLVQVVAPSRPYYQDAQKTPGNVTTFGPDTGTLAVSNITVTNGHAFPERVWIFTPAIASSLPECANGVATYDRSLPGLRVEVPANQTVSISYPSPLVFKPYMGHTCIGAEIDSPYIDLHVNGFVE